jgi:predicted PurR-regulated permease PerM
MATPFVDRPPADSPPRDERIPRGWVHLSVLALLTLVGVYLCYRLTEPFLPALAWAVALAIIADPVHRRVSSRIPRPNWAAAVSTVLVVAIVVVPGSMVLAQLSREATAAGSRAGQVMNGGWREAIAKVPALESTYIRIEPHVDPEQAARRLLAGLTQQAGGVVEGTLAGLLQMLVAVFVLFFVFRDGDHLLREARKFLPVTRDEADYLFTRTSDAVHATVYATVMVGLLQGVTGGLLFWALGLPAPLLWGVVMTILSIIPILGAFLVWAPAAVLLVLDDRWGSALALVVWGLLMAGPVGNYAYAYLAGGRMRLHPVPALLAFIGGLAVFGVSGMVLGPVVVAVTVALIGIWQKRATVPAGRSAVAGPDGSRAKSDVEH